MGGNLQDSYYPKLLCECLDSNLFHKYEMPVFSSYVDMRWTPPPPWDAPAAVSTTKNKTALPRRAYREALMRVFLANNNHFNNSQIISLPTVLDYTKHGFVSHKKIANRSPAKNFQSPPHPPLIFFQSTLDFIFRVVTPEEQKFCRLYIPIVG